MDSEDDSLYNVMIIALIIGIIIVIVTLILTKPAPEKFTELYFNNHKELPKYIDLNEKYNYSFTIHNLEHEEKNYSINITTELYAFDYSCEKPELWLEGNTTKYTDTDEASLYIKEDSYTIKLNYDMINSEYLLIGMKDKYYLNITENSITFNNNTIQTTNTQKGSLMLNFTPEKTLIKVNNYNLTLPTDFNYTKGFPYIETGYTEISGMQIIRNKKQDVIVRIAESKYYEQQLTRKIKILYSRFLANPILEKISSQTIPVKEKNIIEINQTAYTLNILFNNNLNLEFKNLKILYNNNILSVNNNDFLVDKASSLTLVVSNNTKILMNNKNITILELIPEDNPTLEGTIREVTIKNIKEPETIRYRPKPKVIFSGLYNPAIIGQLNKTEVKEEIETLYNRESINWTNYQVSVLYIENLTITKSNINGIIYEIKINNDTALINNKTIKVYPHTINKVVADISENLRVYFNGELIYNEKINDSQGLLFFDSKNLLNAYSEDKDTRMTKIYRRETTTECKPLIINTYTYTDNRTLLHDQSLIYNAYFNIQEPFDIAKIQVSLNDQEIHFWVRQK
ncbi:MAG: hypothetical protein QXK76_03265 [Candidatus Woesearchaeota archaeon]